PRVAGVPPCACPSATGSGAKVSAPAAVLVGWVLSASWPAAPAPSVMPLDVTAVSPVAAKLSVYVPGGPLIANPPKLAAPVVPVVAVAFASVAPAGPGGVDAVSTSPLWLAWLAPESCTCTNGCRAHASPPC